MEPEVAELDKIIRAKRPEQKQPEKLAAILSKAPPMPVAPETAPESGTIPPSMSPNPYPQMRRRGFMDRHVANSGTISPHPESDAVLQKISQAPDGFMFVLCGPRGVGKTQIATTIACKEQDRMAVLWKQFSEENWPLYTTARSIFREIRATFNPNSECDEVKILKRFSESYLLIIDEAQERGNTEWEDKTLTDILDRRYGMRRNTIIISNLLRTQLPAALGPSIISRLHECGEVIECNWPSFREKQG